jgi:hypothetical protein
MSSMQPTGWTKRRPSKNDEWNQRFANRLPHIFIAVIAFGDISQEAYESHVCWAMQIGARLHGKFRVSFGCKAFGRKEQYRARNGALMAATAAGADFLIMLDDDQTLDQCPDMIEKFWDLGQPVAGGLYYHKGAQYHPVVMKEFAGPNGRRKYRYLHVDEIGTEPMPVDVIGGGCHFLDIAVFDRIKEPHYWPFPHEECFIPHEYFGLDVHFCQKMKDAGIQPWLHPGVHLGHIAFERKIVDKTTRPAQSEIEKDPEYSRYWMKVYAEGIGNERVRNSAA